VLPSPSTGKKRKGMERLDFFINNPTVAESAGTSPTVHSQMFRCSIRSANVIAFERRRKGFELGASGGKKKRRAGFGESQVSPDPLFPGKGEFISHSHE